MRRPVILAVLLLLPAFASFGGAADGPQRASVACGRADYPSATAYGPASVVNESLWQSFRNAGGFDGGGEGTGAVEVRVSDDGTIHVVTLEEVVVRAYTGGTATDRTMLALRVRDEDSGGRSLASYNFTALDLGGQSGGNLTLVARPSAGLDVFWRWAYLPCSDTFVNAYYVFHARIAGGRIADENTLAYFEAPRPSRSPPADLILLVTAGFAVTVIFLLARRALKRPRDPPDPAGGSKTQRFK